MNPYDVTSVYQQNSKLGASPIKKPSFGGNPTDNGASFSDLVKQGLQHTADEVKRSENLSKDLIAGKADLQSVVEAVNNAETMIQTVISVRDRLVSAYQEILRTPV